MNRKFLNWLIVVLILAVGIQGYFLYRLSEQLDAATLPVDPAAIESDHEDGVLTLNIKKKSAIG